VTGREGSACGLALRRWRGAPQGHCVTYCHQQHALCLSEELARAELYPAVQLEQRLGSGPIQAAQAPSVHMGPVRQVVKL